MKKNIYSLLNEVETDFTEYDEAILSSEEKEWHKQKMIQEVKSMKKFDNKNSGKRNKWKIAAGSAAACALVIGAMGTANPAVATNLFSHAFGRLIENAQGEKYEKAETEMFTALGKSAVQAQDEAVSRKDKDAFVTTAKDDGVTITVSDIYCDGYVLYYTSTLTTDRDDLKAADGISSKTDDGAYYQELEIDGVDTSGYCSSFQKSEDGTFVAVNQVDLMDAISDSDSGFSKGIEKNGTAIVSWTLKNLTGSFYDQWDEDGEYKTSGKAEGEWNLRFPVTIDHSKNKTYAIHKGQNGFTVQNAILTKAGLVLEVEIPDMGKGEQHIGTDMGVMDAEGNWLQWLNQQTIQHEDGSSTCKIMVLYDGQKDLRFQAVTKEQEPKTLADIEFQIP